MVALVSLPPSHLGQQSESTQWIVHLMGCAAIETSKARA